MVFFFFFISAKGIITFRTEVFGLKGLEDATEQEVLHFLAAGVVRTQNCVLG
jgi:hypothetical protein